MLGRMYDVCVCVSAPLTALVVRPPFGVVFVLWYTPRLFPAGTV